MYRTSDHIHLDVRDMTMEGLRNLILAYVVVERVLIKNVAPERGEHHIFSLPFYKATGDQNHLAALFTDSKAAIYDGARKANKYAALNIRPMHDEGRPRPAPRPPAPGEPMQFIARALPGDRPDHRHGAVGSIEFRFFPSSTDCDLLMHWVNLVQCLKSFAIAHIEWPFAEFPRRVSEVGTEGFLELVFGEYRAKHLKYQGYQNDILEGARNAQDIIFNLRDGENWAEQTLLPQCRESKKDKTQQPFTRYKRKHNKPEVV